jgi:Bacterial self-protective colicin-like immunity
MSLANAFVEGRLTADEFTSVVVRLFKGERDFFDDYAREALFRLFGAAESYCADSALRDRGDLDETELVSEVKGVIAVARSIDESD